MAKRRKAAKPRFPRKQWRPGQQERVENPKKGKGAYRRGGGRRATEGEIEESLDGGLSPRPDRPGKEGEEKPGGA
jgi:hypothetical protein